MALFDDIKDILISIDSKLGSSAPERAAGIGQTSQQPLGAADTFATQRAIQTLAKKSEGGFQKEQYSGLERAIVSAFNNIPVFGQLARAMTGLSPVLRDIVGGTAIGLTLREKQAQAIKVGKQLEDTDALPKLRKKLAYLERLRQEQVKNLNDLKNPTEPQTAKDIQYSGERLRVRREAVSTVFNELEEEIKQLAAKVGKQLADADEAKKAQPTLANFLRRRMEAMDEFFNSTEVAWGNLLGRIPGVKTLAQQARYAYSRLRGSPNASQIAAENPERNKGPLTLEDAVNLGKAPFAIISAGLAAVRFAKTLVESSARLAQFNGQLAVAYAMSDIKGLFREMASAARRAPFISKFLDAWNTFADKNQALFDGIVNDFIELGTGAISAANILVDTFGPAVKGAADWLVWLQHGGKTSQDLASRSKFDQQSAKKFGQAEEAVRKGAIDNKGLEQLNFQKTNLEDSIKALETKKATTLSFTSNDLNELQEEKSKLQLTNTQLMVLKNLKRELDEEKVNGKPDISPFQTPSSSNPFQKAMDKLTDACNEAIAYYSKAGGVPLGAAEFMGMAATWNYDPTKDRAYERLTPLWDAYKKVGR